MQAIKLFGLAALAALLAMAFVGASSAMAEETALCSEDEGSAPTEEACEPITHVHESTLSGHKAILLSSSLEVECDVLFLGDTLGEGLGAPLIIHGAFTYSNCNNSCTATEENGPTEIKVLAEGEELSTVTSGTGGGAGLVHLFCFGFINCRYVGSGLSGHGLGALTSSETNGSVTLSEQTVSKESGSLCPSTSKLDITTTPLEETYIVPRQIYCVKYEHSTHGMYNSNCTVNNQARGYSHMIVFGPPGRSSGQHFCVKMMSPILGLYTGRASTTTCSGDLNNSSQYELGTIL